jgi:hypothetical protein
VDTELERIWEEAVMVSFKLLSLHFPEEELIKPRQQSVRMVGVLAEIRTGHLPNTEEILKDGTTVEDNIKMNRRCKDIDWIKLIQDMDSGGHL